MEGLSDVFYIAVDAAHRKVAPDQQPIKKRKSGIGFNLTDS